MTKCVSSVQLLCCFKNQSSSLSFECWRRLMDLSSAGPAWDRHRSVPGEEHSSPWVRNSRSSTSSCSNFDRSSSEREWIWRLHQLRHWTSSNVSSHRHWQGTRVDRASSSAVEKSSLDNQAIHNLIDANSAPTSYQYAFAAA